MILNGNNLSDDILAKKLLLDNDFCNSCKFFRKYHIYTDKYYCEYHNTDVEISEYCKNWTRRI